MKSREELLKTKAYWMVKLQNDLFSILETHMIDNDITIEQFCEQTGFKKRFVSQVLNGNFNGSIERLIELSLAIDKAPSIEYINISDIATNNIITIVI